MGLGCRNSAVEGHGAEAPDVSGAIFAILRIPDALIRCAAKYNRRNAAWKRPSASQTGGRPGVKASGVPWQKGTPLGRSIARICRSDLQAVLVSPGPPERADAAPTGVGRSSTCQQEQSVTPKSPSKRKGGRRLRLIFKVGAGVEPGQVEFASNLQASIASSRSS